ncbi:MAG: hypothetical protein AAFZ07_07685 [Actinomycetota bacterium]
MPAARHPRREAEALLGDGYDVRLLEPSPPAVVDEWFADDPAAVGAAVPGRRVVTPTSAGDLTWSDLAADDDRIAGFASRRWLGAYRRIGSPPPGFAEARADLNLLAFYVMRPARERVNGKIGLRATADGFGTPFFGEDEQVRVEGTELVHQRGDTVRSAPITTYAAAAAFLDVEVNPDPGGLDVPPLGDAGRELRVEPEHVAYLADWYGFATSVLEELRLDGADDDEMGRVQLWPEHFDPAVELGAVDSGRRASYGCSPGDPGHDEPYLYVAAWGDIDRSEPFWNGEGFNGAELPLAALLDADDQRAAALAFFRRGLSVLLGR